MLKDRKPCKRWKWQAPAKKPRIFKDEIVAFGIKLSCSRPIKPERKCGHKSGSSPIERRRLHDFNAGNSRQSRKVSGVVIHPREHDRYNSARAIPVQRYEKIALIVVAAGPKAAGSMRE